MAVNRSDTLDPDIAAACERADRDAWADFCRAATPDVAAQCGVGLRAIGPAVAGCAARIDILAFNRLVGLGIDAPATAADVAATIEFYAAAGVPRFFVQLGPTAQPPELEGWLTASGLRRYNNWVKLYRNAHDTLRPTPVPGPRVAEIDATEARVAAAIVCTAFRFPDLLVPWAAAVVGRPGWRHYVAYEGDRAVGTAALFVTGDTGWLGLGATVPDARGRGSQSELIVRRMVDAASLGCRWLVVETAQDEPDQPNQSARNLRRLGFEVAYLRPNYLWTRSVSA